MGDVTSIGQLQAGAVGGPVAATEYNGAKASANAASQQAISNLAATAGKLNAPAAFVANQSAQLAAPAVAATNAANTGQRGLGAATGGLNGAVDNYRQAVEAIKPLIQQQMQMQTENPLSGLEATTAMKLLQRNYEMDKYSKAAQAQTLQPTLNQAASSGLDPTAFGTLKNILTASKSAPEALQNLDSHMVLNQDGTPATDDAGNPIYTSDGKATGTLLSQNQIHEIQQFILPAYGLQAPQTNYDPALGPVAQGPSDIAYDPAQAAASASTPQDSLLDLFGNS